MTNSLTTRLSLGLEFNITPWLMSQEETPWMTGITRFKVVNFIFSAVFPSNSVWPMSTSKRRLSLKTQAFLSTKVFLLDTGFSWFSCVYKRMLRWFPSFQVATICFSCSPHDLNFLVTFFCICVRVK